MNKEFQWTDELVHEYLREMIVGKLGFESYSMDKFKSSHSKEEVRDWDIVECRHKIHTSLDWRRTDKESISNLASANFGHNWYIAKVKRLPDGVVFSVGEEVGSKHFSKDKIVLFYIIENDMWVRFESGGECELYWLSKLPERKALLITEDGVAIHNDDSVHYCNIKDWDVSAVYSLFEYRPEPNYKYFSTKEKAEEYVLNNRPLLSINDVKSCEHYDTSMGTYNMMYSDLIELAKSKIK